MSSDQTMTVERSYGYSERRDATDAELRAQLQAAARVIGAALARRIHTDTWRLWHSIDYPQCSRRKVGHRRHGPRGSNQLHAGGSHFKTPTPTDNFPA